MNRSAGCLTCCVADCPVGQGVSPDTALSAPFLADWAVCDTVPLCGTLRSRLTHQSRADAFPTGSPSWPVPVRTRTARA
jgi:hypothetical protein